MRYLLLLLAAVASPAADSPALVRGTGEATIVVQADHTQLQVAVISTAATAARSTARNATRTANLLARVKEILGSDAEIHTDRYSTSHHPVQGYVTTNLIRIRVPEPLLAAKVIEAVSKSGASLVAGFEPSIADEQAARQEAIRQATVRARADAELMAAALRMRVERIVSAEPSVARVPALPMQQPGMHGTKKKGGVEVPIEKPVIEIRAQVVLTVEAAP
jgi:uncharacterized protein YggE